ncbi:zinc-ribbon domain-containing protein [Clostridium sp. Marseille-P2415]|uniref:zinc-ribbon domain-containing protein n=1 Tax=Clostridium sp. Marseille-P2415 TaxID=1805471 RepID=UPI0009883DC4|nr:zinc-ribbon domain-containing protein [Clostridium sp. Marseille-P2415]
MYCKNCAKEIDDKAAICPHCGVSQVTAPQVVDNGGIGWGLLGCCIPLVGLILFLVWKDTKPKTAKAAGIGALVSVCCVVLFYALIFGLGIMGAIGSSVY